jgi:hypothetical protein
MKNAGSKGVLVFAGAALVAGFFLPWVDAGGSFSFSGFDLVLESHQGLFARIVVLMVPLLGASLVVAGLRGGKSAVTTALVTGGAILGYPTYKFIVGFIQTTGVGLWMVLGAAILALVVGLSARTKKPAAKPSV